MDIVDFLKQQTEIWDNEQKCGFCWNFGAPLVNSQLNIEQDAENEACCVSIFVTDITGGENLSYNTAGLVTTAYCDKTFTMYALIKSPMGVNNYTEIKGHPVEESKWNTIFKPLEDCLTCGNPFDFCEILGYNMQTTSKRWSIVHNWLNNNYNGWKFTFTIRKSQ